MYNYGVMLYNGIGVNLNKKEAAKYFKMAADEGDVSGMRNYAIMLENGEGMKANKREAARIFKLIEGK